MLSHFNLMHKIDPLTFNKLLMPLIPDILNIFDVSTIIKFSRMLLGERERERSGS